MSYADVDDISSQRAQNIMRKYITDTRTMRWEIILRTPAVWSYAIRRYATLGSNRLQRRKSAEKHS